MRPDPEQFRLPLALKLVFTAWILLWAPSVITMLGPQNFLWACNLANFFILIGLWLDSRLVLSTQWLMVSLLGLFWTIDVVTAALTGIHPIGGTSYMLDPDFPTSAKFLSLYHVFLPLLTGYTVYRLGYDRRALSWQAALVTLLVPASWWLTEPERNINLAHEAVLIGLGGLPTHIYLPVLLVGWIVVLLLPVHLFSAWLQRRGKIG
ncbi:MAG: hypothetical protein ACXIUB_08870 [Wenzhouxiangella sp.]